MAIAKHLPIYKRLAELALLVSELIANWRRPFGFTLGQRVLNECFDLSLLIFRANSASGQERVGHIQQALEKLQVIELSLRLAVDLGGAQPEAARAHRRPHRRHRPAGHGMEKKCRRIARGMRVTALMTVRF